MNSKRFTCQPENRLRGVLRTTLVDLLKSRRSYYMSEGGRRVLIITRRAGEDLPIPDDMDVTLLEVTRDRIKLGLEPRGLRSAG